MIDQEYDAGIGTTVDMWKMVSDLLDDEKLPESINKAIYALCDGEAYIKAKEPAPR